MAIRSKGGTLRRTPDRGDVLWMDLGPTSGHEQKGRRPCLVVSPVSYNRHGLALVCPITTKRKGYPFEVLLPVGHATEGVVLADHLRTIDWRARSAEHRDRIPEIIPDVIAKARTLLGP